MNEEEFRAFVNTPTGKGLTRMVVQMLIQAAIARAFAPDRDVPDRDIPNRDGKNPPAREAEGE